MPGEALGRIRGLPDIPSITEVNVRPVPGTNQETVFKVPVGMSGLSILEVQPDVENKNLNGKVYQWFKLQFDGGAVGWVRDDLLEVQGNLTAFGYPDLAEQQFAHALVRNTAPAPAAPAAPAPAPAPTPEVTVTVSSPQPTAPAAPAPTPEVTVTVSSPQSTAPAPAPTTAGAFPDALADTDRVRRAAFAITAAFEGTGYAAYNNYDAGIVSYGLIQFTLAAGSLGKVLSTYTARSQSDTAKGLLGYMERVNARDGNLRTDGNFKNLLIAAANEPEMRAAQDQVATEGYWQSVLNGYITQRGLRLPTTWALLFDMGVNFGVNHGFVRLAEEQLGVPKRSKPGENGITEEQLILRVAELRKQSHDRQAERDNLPGLRVRGDFWVNLMNNGDWYLQGTNGQVNVNGRMISVK